MKQIICTLLCMLSVFGHAQVFPLNEFIQTIEQNHPVISRIQLLEQSADAQLQMSRGAFDPYIATESAQKAYADKLYYRMWNSTLTIPIYSGIELYAGHMQNAGVFLDPSQTLPNDGLIKAGIKADVLQGLITNRRQTDLAQAKILQDANENTRQLQRNAVYYEAIRDYMDWSRSYQVLQLHSNFIERAQIRYAGVLAMHQLGDIAAIDTLEAFIQLQDRITAYNEAFLQYIYALQAVNAYLWNADLQPVQLRDDQLPEPLDSLRIFNGIAPRADWNAHPEILSYTYTWKSLDLERKLKSQYLLPKVSISYGMLYPVGLTGTEVLRPNDYQLALSLQYPLFTRSARGSLELTRIAQENTDLLRVEKMNDLRIRAQVYTQEAQVKQEQMQLYQTMRTNAFDLLQAEETKFSIGESSLFLVNTRELFYMNSSVKYIQSQFAWRDAILKQLLNDATITASIGIN